MSSSGIDKVLLLADDKNSNHSVKSLVVEGLKHPHRIDEIRLDRNCLPIVRQGDYGLLIIVSDLHNNLSIDIVRAATKHPTASIIYICEENDLMDDASVEAKAELLELGATLIMKPVTKKQFMVALNAADMAHIRLCVLKKKLETEKIINRSKLILMEVLGMSEEQAHKYIERESMNNGVSKLDTAYDILRQYGF